MLHAFTHLDAKSPKDLAFAECALLALTLCPGLGVKRAQQILMRFDLKALFSSSTHLLIEQGMPSELAQRLARFDFDHLSRQLHDYRQQGIQITSLLHPDYPVLLSEIPDPPLLLFTYGNVQLLNEPQVAIVGSRGASSSGKQQAFELAQYLAQANITVTSGLAMGIDAQAHKGALSVSGNTIGVLGTGVDRCYPKRNQGLWQQVQTHGVLVSEFLPGMGAQAHHFPRRNRIIAGLSLATVVVEAELKSGSLITAELANDYNREVMAMPGSIHNPYARGCHALIKQGAALVENAQDILNELGFFQQNSLYIESEVVKKEDNSTVLRHIGYAPTAVDEIALRAKLPIDALLTELVDLELEGVIESVAGGYIRKEGG